MPKQGCPTQVVGDDEELDGETLELEELGETLELEELGELLELEELGELELLDELGELDDELGELLELEELGELELLELDELDDELEGTAQQQCIGGIICSTY